jgi:hypothetical protein
LIINNIDSFRMTNKLITFSLFFITLGYVSAFRPPPKIVMDALKRKEVV